MWMRTSEHRHRGGVIIQVIVVIVLLALMIAWLVPTIRTARDRAAMTGCQDNLRRLGTALSQYASANRGEFPMAPTIQNPQTELVQSLSASLKDSHDFYCPAEKDPDLVFTGEHRRAGVIGYYYYSALSAGDPQSLGRLLREEATWPRVLTTQSPPETWLMSDIWRSSQPTSHTASRKCINYLRVDASVSTINETPRKTFK